MNIEDYELYKNCLKLCEELELVFSVEDDNFLIDNTEVYLGKFDNISDMFYWLKGFKQCKRILDKEFNQSILDSEYNYE